MSATVLDYVQDIVYNLNKGRIDQCLSNRLSPDTLNSLDSHHADLANSLDTALKNIAQRQLQLETENLRYRIALQQQHQLLTTQQTDDQDCADSRPTSPVPTTTNNNNSNSKSNAIQDESHDTAISTTHAIPSTASTAAAHTTPEEGIPSVKDASLIDRMQTPAHPIVSLSSNRCMCMCTFFFSLFFSLFWFPNVCFSFLV